ENGRLGSLCLLEGGRDQSHLFEIATQAFDRNRFARHIERAELLSLRPAVKLRVTEFRISILIPEATKTAAPPRSSRKPRRSFRGRTSYLWIIATRFSKMRLFFTDFSCRKEGLASRFSKSISKARPQKNRYKTATGKGLRGI